MALVRQILRPWWQPLDLDLRHREDVLHGLATRLLQLPLLLQPLEARSLGRFHERKARIDDQTDDDQQVGDDRKEDLLEPRERTLEYGGLRPVILKVEVHQRFTRL